MSALRRVRFVRVRHVAELDSLRIAFPACRLLIGWCEGKIIIRCHERYKAQVVRAAGAAFVELPHYERRRLYAALRDGKLLISEVEARRYAALADKQLVEVFG